MSGLALKEACLSSHVSLLLSLSLCAQHMSLRQLPPPHALSLTPVDWG